MRLRSIMSRRVVRLEGAVLARTKEAEDDEGRLWTRMVLADNQARTIVLDMADALDDGDSETGLRLAARLAERMEAAYPNWAARKEAGACAPAA